MWSRSVHTVRQQQWFFVFFFALPLKVFTLYGNNNSNNALLAAAAAAATAAAAAAVAATQMGSEPIYLHCHCHNHCRCRTMWMIPLVTMEYNCYCNISCHCRNRCYTVWTDLKPSILSAWFRVECLRLSRNYMSRQKKRFQGKPVHFQSHVSFIWSTVCWYGCTNNW